MQGLFTWDQRLLTCSPIDISPTTTLIIVIPAKAGIQMSRLPENNAGFPLYFFSSCLWALVAELLQVD